MTSVRESCVTSLRIRGIVMNSVRADAQRSSRREGLLLKRRSGRRV